MDTTKKPFRFESTKRPFRFEVYSGESYVLFSVDIEMELKGNTLVCERIEGTPDATGTASAYRLTNLESRRYAEGDCLLGNAPEPQGAVGRLNPLRFASLTWVVDYPPIEMPKAEFTPAFLLLGYSESEALQRKLRKEATDRVVQSAKDALDYLRQQNQDVVIERIGLAASLIELAKYASVKKA